MTWVYRTESKGIQSWILSTDRMRDLLGGSSRIEGLVEHARRGVEAAGGKIVMAAAGGVTATFDEPERLAVFASDWPMFASLYAPGLTVVQAWVDSDAPDSGQLLADRLAQARNQPMPRLPEPGPLVLRSGRSGEPAVDAHPRRGTLDAAMVAKGRAASGPSADPIADRLEQAGLSRPRFVRGDGLGEVGMDEGYVAVVHMDGNGVGQIVIDLLNRGTEGLGALARFSERLEEATARAVAGALATTLALESRRHHDGTIRARPVVLGGDDVTFIVPAADALLFSRALLRSFEDATKGLGPDGTPLTSCAGVAIVKAHWPFHAAHQLAEELCRAAKQGLKKDGVSRSGLAFHRVTTALADDWSTMLRTELAAPRPADWTADPGSDASWVMTGNPYDLEGLDRLDTLALALEHLPIPRGALRRWVDLCRLDPGAAKKHWARFEAVSGERHKEKFASWRALLKDAGVDPKTGWAKTKDGGGRTPIPDLVEWGATVRHERRMAGGRA